MKLHDDLINEIEPSETVNDSVKALMLGIADRIEACRGNAVRLSDLASVLREDPEKIGKAVVANTPNNTEKVRTTPYDAPSTAFDKPRENARNGMVDADEKREQQERERVKREDDAKAQGKTAFAV